MVVGYLHPGEMGAALAGSSPGGLWLADGRSDATAARAAAAGLDDAGTLEALVERADVVVSVCPPGAALEVADAVATAGFSGIYADLNATSPETARSIDARFDRFVDGGIIGPPPRVPGTTRLYLAGPEETASTVAAIWQGSALDVRRVSSRVGAASAIKACYAAWTKISAALLLTTYAAAVAEGVDDDLRAEWDISQPGLVAAIERAATGQASKAWRFVGEMHEIVDTLAANGLPDGFARAAADAFTNLESLRQRPDAGLPDVVAAFLDPRG